MIYLALLILVLLLVAHIYIARLIKQNPTNERLNNKKRIISWWVIFSLCVSVLLLSAMLGTSVIIVFVGILFAWCIIELNALLHANLTSKVVTVLVIFLLMVLSFIFSTNHYSQYKFCFFITPFAMAFVVYLISSSSRWYFLLFSAYCYVALFSIVFLAELANSQLLDFPYLILILFFITSINDIAQYVTGKLFGETPIASKISPNKTIEGVWGGIIISAFLAVMLLPTVITVTLLGAFAMGVLLSLAGVFGDLMVSKLKRELNLKDSGNSIAGHGGILDRMDSLLLSAPAFGLALSLGGQL